MGRLSFYKSYNYYKGSIRICIRLYIGLGVVMRAAIRDMGPLWGLGYLGLDFRVDGYRYTPTSHCKMLEKTSGCFQSWTMESGEMSQDVACFRAFRVSLRFLCRGFSNPNSNVGSKLSARIPSKAPNKCRVGSGCPACSQAEMA